MGRIRILHADGLRWAARIEGQVRATVEYDARAVGAEVIRVNGRVVCQQSAILGYHSEFRFSLPAGRGAVPARLEVKVSLWHALTALRLTVDGHVLYADGDLAVRGVGSDLPIPTDSPRFDLDTLPQPGTEPGYLPREKDS